MDLKADDNLIFGKTMALHVYKLMDTHAHICDPVFDPDRDEVLVRARNAGV